MPEFLGAIACATEEKHIRAACEEIKEAVVESYPNTPSSRKNPMTEIRDAVRGKFPTQSVESEVTAEFPYFYTATGKKRDPEKNIPNHRLEHLAIKYLEAEWDRKTDRSFEEVEQGTELSKDTEVEPMNSEVAELGVVIPEIDILGYVGLDENELETVKQAIGDADIKEWVKQAMLQRANAINALRERLEEDLTMVPSSELMNEKKYRTNTNATRELVKRAVRVIKDWNHNHPDQKWCITNKLISEVTKSVDKEDKGVTVKAIAKAVEGMDLKSYNENQGLEPVVNRTLKGTLGEPSTLMSIKDTLGIDD